MNTFFFYYEVAIPVILLTNSLKILEADNSEAGSASPLHVLFPIRSFSVETIMVLTNSKCCSEGYKEFIGLTLEEIW